MFSKKLTMSLVAVAACTAGGDSAQLSTHTSTMRIDRIEHAADGVPYHARGALGRVKAPVHDLADAVALDSVLPGIAATFRVPAQSLVAKRVMRDDLGMTHVHYAQRKNGLRVVGGDLVVHLDAYGDVRSVNSTARDIEGLPSTATFSADEAANTAVASTAGGLADVKGTPELVYLLKQDNTMHLAWEVFVHARQQLVRDKLYISAVDGKLIARRSQVHTARNRTIYDADNGIYGFGHTETQIGTENSPPQNDATARAAYDNTGTSYDCLKTLFNRDSYDGVGATLKSVVHIQFFTGNGTTGNNAAWTGDSMVYGDGDGTTFRPLALALDVTAHELVHAVTSSTANLEYQDESGALNEAMSDIMAAACEAHKDGAISADTWLIGEDIFTPNKAGDALRWMKDPTKDKEIYMDPVFFSRDWYPERYTGQDDAGGVHINSGIANLAFALLVDGGTHPRMKSTFPVPAIGMQKAAQIYYRALTMGYFTANTNLNQARTETVEVATLLHPGTESAVGTAWAAVGVGAAPAPDTVPPVVAITNPADGATVDAGFAVGVTATDDRVVTKVELSIDGLAAGTDTTAPYEFTADANLAPGTHTIKATAFDGTNMASSTIMVTIEGEDPVTPDAGVDPNNPADGEGGGCCSTSNKSEPVGALMLFGMTMLALRRRRR